uniref:Uncharacterized protein n=1 Tax=Candidatus Kentrum sp. MB TaxID=2138164 RepID=A0A450Y0L7_9GAMM|nr:MAG: hypothetical protein BECKMB1821G_GA0114241_11037 [Candidatus Kentron sp. MB]VFK35087.1 MAG: hypothetical protein BECKMB1821I_GA0114274_10997 [Candidatus Kentron sp. MB]VFK76218.1 MAG: hypothetical protein BECKMB1821H_GA0114242_104622 [Candidatus Kentron sp. MB]
MGLINVDLYSRQLLGVLTIVAAFITLVSFSGIIGTASNNRLRYSAYWDAQPNGSHNVTWSLP